KGSARRRSPRAAMCRTNSRACPAGGPSRRGGVLREGRAAGLAPQGRAAGDGLERRDANVDLLHPGTGEREGTVEPMVGKVYQAGGPVADQVREAGEPVAGKFPEADGALREEDEELVKPPDDVGEECRGGRDAREGVGAVQHTH